MIVNRPLPARTEIYVQTLPYECKKVVIEGTTYYSGENNLFLPTNKGYVVIDNEEDYDVVEDNNVVTELPAGSKRIICDGKLYWYGGDTWFYPIEGGYLIVDEPYK